MIIACDVKSGFAEKLPSVVHIDNTVRVQSVSERTNKNFYNLISEFGKITGYYVVLNTSFNIKGEPIVASPDDAINCFLKTGIDVLVLGSYIIEK